MEPWGLERRSPTLWQAELVLWKPRRKWATYGCRYSISALEDHTHVILEATPPRDEVDLGSSPDRWQNRFPTDYTTDRQATGTRSRANPVPAQGRGRPCWCVRSRDPYHPLSPLKSIGTAEGGSELLGGSKGWESLSRKGHGSNK